MFHSMSNNNKCPEWLSWLLHTHVPPKKVIWRLSSPHLIHISNYHTLLECEVKWALESITTNKASGGDKIPAELFQILKDDAVKVLHLTYQQIWKTQQWPQDWKKSVFILLPNKGNAKECSNYIQSLQSMGWQRIEYNLATEQHTHLEHFLCGSTVKNPPAKAGDTGLIPELGRYPREGNVNPLQYSCLGNPMDGEAWWATVHGLTKELDVT